MIDVCMCVHATRQHPSETYFLTCVNQLRQTLPDHRLILLADACDEQAWQVVLDVAKQDRRTLLVRTGYQRWFTRAYNIALRLVRTPQALLLNTDLEFGSGWLEEMQACWREVEAQGHRVGLVGSVFSAEEGRRYMLSYPPDYVTAHCWLVDMHAITQASVDRGTPGWYLDETSQLMIHIRSDVELSQRLNGCGFTTIKSFKSQVGHHGGKSWGHNLAMINGVTLEDVSD